MNTTTNAHAQDCFSTPQFGTGSPRLLPASGLRLLLEAYEYASELVEDIWEFAIEAPSLASEGLTNTHLRWLLYHGYALQAIERTATQARRRSFRRKRNLSLSPPACFVLTEAGVAYARRCSLLNLEGAASYQGEELPPPSIPIPQHPSAVGVLPAELNSLVMTYRVLGEAIPAAAGRRHRAESIAIPLERLHQLGIENDVLLRMMYHAHVGHVRPSLHSTARFFPPIPVCSARIGPGSAFYLTELGKDFAAPFLQRGLPPAAKGTRDKALNQLLSSRIVPCYVREQRSWCWGVHVLKTFRQALGNQELILESAEELGWPTWFDDPLPRRAGKNPKTLLQDTLRDLNRRQKPCLIHFMGDGTGTRIGWEYR